MNTNNIGMVMSIAMAILPALIYAQDVFDYEHEGLNLVYKVTDEDQHYCKVLYVPAAFPYDIDNETFIPNYFAIPSRVYNNYKEEYIVTEISDEAFMDYDLSKILEIPESITKVGIRAFINSRLETIIINGKIENLPSKIFAGCDQLHALVINSIEPPIICDDTFPDSVLQNAVLRLPEGSRALYEIDSAWNRFNYFQHDDQYEDTHERGLRIGADGMLRSRSSAGVSIIPYTSGIGCKNVVK